MEVSIRAAPRAEVLKGTAAQLRGACPLKLCPALTSCKSLPPMGTVPARGDAPPDLQVRGCVQAAELMGQVQEVQDTSPALSPTPPGPGDGLQGRADPWRLSGRKEGDWRQDCARRLRVLD